MGELKKSIFNIGSPDLDVILNKKLPKISSVKKRYSIKFNNYCILIWHPVTSQIKTLKNDTIKLLDFMKELRRNVVVIYPNNDPGSEIILNCFKKFKNEKVKLLKSLRFENFITLLKNSEFIIGNSSSAIYEAPILGTPSINIGNRQHKRASFRSIKNLKLKNLKVEIIESFLKKYEKPKNYFFGIGKSDTKFINILKNKNFWRISNQKYFSDEKNKNEFFK